MAHSRGFDLSHLSDAALDGLSHQLASLNRDGAHLSRALRHYGRDAGHELGHFAHDVADNALHQGAVAAGILGKQARRAGKAVKRDPAPAVAAVIGLACLMSLVMASPSRRR